MHYYFKDKEDNIQTKGPAGYGSTHRDHSNLKIRIRGRSKDVDCLVSRPYDTAFSKSRKNKGQQDVGFQ
jgi:hypothetical protein